MKRDDDLFSDEDDQLFVSSDEENSRKTKLGDGPKRITPSSSTQVTTRSSLSKSELDLDADELDFGSDEEIVLVQKKTTITTTKKIPYRGMGCIDIRINSY